MCRLVSRRSLCLSLLQQIGSLQGLGLPLSALSLELNDGHTQEGTRRPGSLRQLPFRAGTQLLPNLDAPGKRSLAPALLHALSPRPPIPEKSVTPRLPLLCFINVQAS